MPILIFLGGAKVLLSACNKTDHSFLDGREQRIMEAYLERLYEWLLSSGLRILAIIVVSFIFVRVAKMIITRSKNKFSAIGKNGIERAKRTETLAGLIEKTVRALVLVAATLMVLEALGLDIGPLLAGAGVVGLAVGFGAQNLVKDVIGGFFILLENHMNVGDVVKIAGVAGQVESINLRVTTLRDLGGNMHIIPNGHIDVVTNMTKEWSRALIEVGVAYKENADEVMKMIEKVGEELRNDPVFGKKILEPLEMLGLDSFGDSSVNFKMRIKTKPIEQWAVTREFNRRIKKVFDEKGIEIPFPHVTLYMGEGENEGVLKVSGTKEV
jgi:small conductance mechanosensitive channel